MPETIEKRVIPFRATTPAPESSPWRAAAQVRAADVDDLMAMCTWYDSENEDVKSSYKLPHHNASDGYPVVWRGVAAAMGALLGARGGVAIPDSDRRAVYNHLAKHYKQFDKEPPDFASLDDMSENEKRKFGFLDDDDDGLSDDENKTDVTHKQISQDLVRLEAGSRQVVAVISNDSVDRDNEILLATGADLKDYNGIVLFGHNPTTPHFAVGRAVWTKKNPSGKGAREIIQKQQYANTEDGQLVFQLLQEGVLNSFSVSFRVGSGQNGVPTERELKDHPEWAGVDWVYRKWKLLEASVVSVPANPQATAISVAKGKLCLDCSAGRIIKSYLPEVPMSRSGFVAPEFIEEVTAVEFGSVIEEHMGYGSPVICEGVDCGGWKKRLTEEVIDRVGQKALIEKGDKVVADTVARLLSVAKG